MKITKLITDNREGDMKVRIKEENDINSDDIIVFDMIVGSSLNKMKSVNVDKIFDDLINSYENIEDILKIEDIIMILKHSISRGYYEPIEVTHGFIVFTNILTFHISILVDVVIIFYYFLDENKHLSLRMVKNKHYSKLFDFFYKNEKIKKIFDLSNAIPLF